MSHPTVAVIGAGMAGLACASILRRAGLAVEVFEKSRGLGGRIATRRVDGLSFDHGAQYATARGTVFPALMRDLTATGAVVEWRPTIRDLRLGDDGRPAEEDGFEPAAGRSRDVWYVGTPGMNAMVKPMADGLTIHRLSRVTALSRRRDGWHCALADGGANAGPFAAVAVTAPAPQTVELLAPFGAVFDRAASAAMAPCWTLMAAFGSRLDIDDVIRPSRGPITWAARRHARTVRSPDPECWVIHGEPVWSRDHLEDAPEAIADALGSAFAEATGCVERQTYAAAHRWRYARVANPLGEPCLLSEDGTLGAAGDWCLGARIEAAYDSGHALGKALAATLAPLTLTR